MRVIVVLVALGSIGCGLTGPSENLTGHWVAQSIGHTTLVGMTLQQSGDEITGTACSTDGGRLTYSGVPVVGDYPKLHYTVSERLGFAGKQDRTLDIVGDYGTIDLRFQRSATSICN